MTLQNPTPPAHVIRFGLVAASGLTAGATAGLFVTLVFALATL